MIRDNARTFRVATRTAFADLRATYTWRTWTFAWLSRILCQVIFFVLLGRLLNSPASTEYLLIGNSVYIVASVSMLVCVSSAWERQNGTLALLVASPTSPFFVFAGRSVQWLLDGTACALVPLVLLPFVFNVEFPPSRLAIAVPVVMITGLSTYCFGLMLGGIVLRKLDLRNVVSNLSHLTLMAFCGVQVPVTFWPTPIRAVAAVLPLTHGLAAVRTLLGGGAVRLAARDAGLEIAVGLGWLLLAGLVFKRLAEGGRKDGSIELSETG